MNKELNQAIIEVLTSRKKSDCKKACSIVEKAGYNICKEQIKHYGDALVIYANGDERKHIYMTIKDVWEEIRDRLYGDGWIREFTLHVESRTTYSEKNIICDMTKIDFANILDTPVNTAFYRKQNLLSPTAFKRRNDIEFAKHTAGFYDKYIERVKNDLEELTNDYHKRYHEKVNELCGYYQNKSDAMCEAIRVYEQYGIKTHSMYGENA